MTTTTFLNRLALATLLAVAIVACGGKDKAADGKTEPKKRLLLKKQKGMSMFPRWRNLAWRSPLI